MTEHDNPNQGTNATLTDAIGPYTHIGYEATPPPAPWYRRYFQPSTRWPELPPTPEGGLRPGWRVRVEIRADWRDRLRFLWSGRAEVLVTTATDRRVVVGDSVSAFTVLPPKAKGEK